jgi:hypothetical protein
MTKELTKAAPNRRGCADQYRGRGGSGSPRYPASRVDNANLLTIGRAAFQHQAPDHPAQLSTARQPRSWIRSQRSGAGMLGCARQAHQRTRQRFWRADEAHVLPMRPPAPMCAWDRLASLTGWLGQEGIRPMLRSHRKGSHARVLASSLGKEERKARARGPGTGEHQNPSRNVGIGADHLSKSRGGGGNSSAFAYIDLQSQFRGRRSQNLSFDIVRRCWQ